MNRDVAIAMVLLVGIGGVFLGCTSEPPVEAKTPVTKVESAELAAPADAKLVMRLRASGDQVYTVQTGANGALEWSGATPDAKLFNEKGEQVGTHGKGPSWTLADGGTVIGQLPPVKKVAVDPAAVPWLELNVKGSSASGSLKEVTVIQRVKTAGGVPPAKELKEGNLGKEVRVGYTAEYLFYR